MKTALSAIFVFVIHFAFAQYITLSKAVKISDNRDKFFYQVTDTIASQYLGEVEVQGFSNDDASVFSQVYQKAKTIGANSFSIKKEERIDGGSKAFNPSHYYINLYYTSDFNHQDHNQVYIFSSSNKDIKFRLKDKSITLPSRTYYQFQLHPGEDYPLATGGFLGSRIRLAYKEAQPAQYFSLMGAGFRADGAGTGMLNLKSGDIIFLEKSYAQFLSAIYQQIP